MKRILLTLFLVWAMVLAFPLSAMAATTADVTVTATPNFVGISNAPGSMDYAGVTASVDEETVTNYFTVTNTSSVSTNVTVSVTTATWAGGVTWTHSDTATAGANQAGLKANENGTWGVGDVIVKNAAPNNLVTGKAATTNWFWGLKLIAPTSFTDGVEKSITVRLSASAA